MPGLLIAKQGQPSMGFARGPVPPCRPTTFDSGDRTRRGGVWNFEPVHRSALAPRRSVAPPARKDNECDGSDGRNPRSGQCGQHAVAHHEHGYSTRDHVLSGCTFMFASFFRHSKSLIFRFRRRFQHRYKYRLTARSPADTQMSGSQDPDTTVAAPAASSDTAAPTTIVCSSTGILPSLGDILLFIGQRPA